MNKKTTRIIPDLAFTLLLGTALLTTACPHSYSPVEYHSREEKTENKSWEPNEGLGDEESPREQELCNWDDAAVAMTLSETSRRGTLFDYLDGAYLDTDLFK